MPDFTPDLSLNQLPPQNIEAEEIILGGILFDSNAIKKVIDLLPAEAFYVQAHRHIYEAAKALYNKGDPTDITGITIWLNDNRLLEKVGGQAKLSNLANSTVSAVNIERYVPFIMEKYLRRKLIQSGQEIIELGFDSTEELDNVLDESEQKIFNLTQSRIQEGLVPLSDIINETFSELEKLHQKLALPGIKSGFYDLDAMTSGFQRSDLIIIAGRPAMGKCLAGNAEIVLKDGSIATIAKIFEQKKASLLTLTNNWQFELTKTSNFIDDGIKPVFRVKTKLGRYIDTTLTHPYLTIEGWQKLGELKVGNKIAVPRELNIFGTEKMPEYQVKLLAYFIGDGCLTRTSPQFTNNNLLIQEDKKLCKLLNVEAQSLAKYGIETISNNSKNSVTLWLESLKIWGKNAHQKTIPPIIFTLRKSLIALFLNRLFATDGWASVLKTGQVQLGYGTVSQKLAEQIQHLLLRFGIIASLKERQIKYNNTLKKTWQIDITHPESIKLFIENISIYGKETAINLVQEALINKKNHHNLDLIPVEIWSKIEAIKGAETWSSLAKKMGLKSSSNLHVGQRSLSRNRLFQLGLTLDNLELQQIATSAIYWDEIMSIEYLGEQQVYDLTISKTHNFVANNICVHNTSFALNIATNIAKEDDSTVAIFSLEMSKSQLAMRLLSSEAKIDSNKIKAGRFTENEMEPLVAAMGDLAELPIYIDDTGNLTIMQMRSEVRRLQAEKKGKLGLILLDYLQLMEGNSNQNRVQELSKITRSLKILAREVNCPIIALSQLSRGVEQRTSKRPILSDLRESGSIEQDADLVLMLYRDEYYNPDSADCGTAEVIISKHRNGPTGQVRLIFKPELTLFLNLQKRQD